MNAYATPASSRTVLTWISTRHGLRKSMPVVPWSIHAKGAPTIHVLSKTEIPEVSAGHLRSTRSKSAKRPTNMLRRAQITCSQALAAAAMSVCATTQK